MRASSGVRASRSVHTTALPAGSRARVTPCATISESHSTAQPERSARLAACAKPCPKRMLAATSTSPQAWITRTATGTSSGWKRARSASARMMANDRA